MIAAGIVVSEQVQAHDVGVMRKVELLHSGEKEEERERKRKREREREREKEREGERERERGGKKEINEIINKTPKYHFNFIIFLHSKPQYNHKLNNSEISQSFTR